MKTISTALLLIATVAVTGCTRTTTVQGKTSEVMPMSTYDAKTLNGSNNNYSEITSEDGLVAVVGNTDGTLSEVRYRLNEERNVLYVSKDGGEEVEYATMVSNSTNGSTYQYGEWQNEDGERIYLNVHTNNNNNAYFRVRDSEGQYIAEGYGGLQTAPENLPENAVYNGNYYLRPGDNENYYYNYANMTMDVDFANGDISGAVSNAYIYDEGTAANYYGTIDGTVTNGRVAGTVFAEGDATGELDFAGAATGDDANRISGGIAGTLTIGEEEDTYGGHFDTYRQVPAANAD